MRTIEIAREAGVTDRAVRLAIARHRLPHPVRLQRWQVDVDEVAARRRDGATIEELAREFGVGTRRIVDVLAELGEGLERRRVSRRGSRYPVLNDRDWLAGRMAAGASIKGLARELGCDRATVRYALVQHGLRDG